MPIFEIPEQGKDIDIMGKFEQYCIGETNEIYERYRFNTHDQNEHDICVTSVRMHSGKNIQFWSVGK